MDQFRQELKQFMIQIVLDLVTKPGIDHRNYASPPFPPSRFTELFLSHGMDYAISQLSQEVIANVIQPLPSFQWIDDPDLRYEHELTLYSDFVELTGFYELNNLHEDENKKYREQLRDLVITRYPQAPSM